MAWAAARGDEIATHANGRVFLNFTGRTTTAPSVDDASAGTWSGSAG